MKPSKLQLTIWTAYFYDGLSQAEAMRRLNLKHRAGFHWTMIHVTKYVLSKHPRL